MSDEQKYTIQGLDEYIRQGEPQKRERSEAWRITGRFFDPLKMAESITDLRTHESTKTRK